MIIKKEEIFDYLESITGDKCYVGLHGIADRSDIQNEYSNLSKIEKAENMLKIGIINARGSSMQATVQFFGNLSAQNDVACVQAINNYSFYSFQSRKEVVMVVAIPIIFNKTDGHAFFGGWIDGKDTENPERFESISDYCVFMGDNKKNHMEVIIPSEFIFGYYTYTKGDEKVEMTLNPRFYYNLSNEEKDTFISNFIPKSCEIDIYQKKSSIVEQINIIGRKYLKAKTLAQVEEYFTPEYQKRMRERERQKIICTKDGNQEKDIEKIEELRSLIQRDNELSTQLDEARKLEEAYKSQTQINEENAKKDVDSYGE